MKDQDKQAPKFIGYFKKKMYGLKTEEHVEVKTPMTGYSRTKVLASKPKTKEREI